MVRARVRWPIAAFAAALVAACGGGGGNGSLPAAAPSPSASPSIGVTFAAQPSSAQIPSGAGISGSILLPAGTGTATLTASAQNPTGTPLNGANTAIAYVTLTATNGAVTMQGLPGFTAALPAGAPSGTYFVARYIDAAQPPVWTSTTASGSSGSGGSTVTIPATASPAVAVASGQSMYFAVYYGSYIPLINASYCAAVYQPLPARERTRAFTGVHPIAPGDAYSFSGSLDDTIVQSQPCPQPTATARANVAVAVQLSAGPGASSIENSVETDTYATTTTSLSVAATVTQTSGGYFESSETATDGYGNTMTTAYAARGLQYGEGNPLAGNQWSNPPPATVQQTMADGVRASRIYNPNGSYVETDAMPGSSVTNQIVVNSDESGSYANGSGTSYASTLSMSAPSNGSIAIALGTQRLTIPSWLPLNGTLYADTTIDTGPVPSLPPGCAFPVGFTAPEHLQRSVQTVDPVLGTLETKIVDSYDVPNFNGGVTLGPVCEILSDTLAQYYVYGWTTTQPWIFSENAQPLVTNTITETLSLQTAGLIANARLRKASAAIEAQANARQAGIAFARALERERRIEALERCGKGTPSCAQRAGSGPL